MSLCLAPLQILGVQFMVWPRGKCVIFRFGAFSLSQGPPSYCPYYPIIKSWLITGPLHSPAPADKSDTSWRGEKGENFFLSPLIFSFLPPSLSNLTFSTLWIFFLANLVFSLNFSTLWIHLIFHCFELEIRRLHWLFNFASQVAVWECAKSHWLHLFESRIEFHVLRSELEMPL